MKLLMEVFGAFGTAIVILSVALLIFFFVSCGFDNACWWSTYQ